MKLNTYDEMLVVIEAKSDGKPTELYNRYQKSWCKDSGEHPNFNYYTYRVKRVPREWYASVKNGVLFLGHVTGMEHVTVREVL
jgi:hypothetical protein